jgi:hypothetical protein
MRIGIVYSRIIQNSLWAIPAKENENGLLIPPIYKCFALTILPFLAFLAGCSQKNQNLFFMWCRALARGNINVLGILRAEALYHMKAVLLKLHIMGCGRRSCYVIRGVFPAEHPCIEGGDYQSAP